MFFLNEQKTSPETDSPKSTKPPKTEEKEKHSIEEGEEVSEEENNGSEVEEDEGHDAEDKPKPKKTQVEEEEEEEDWDSYKMESKKENSLDTKLKESHLVHCPYFPGVSMSFGVFSWISHFYHGLCSEWLKQLLINYSHSLTSVYTE